MKKYVSFVLCLVLIASVSITALATYDPSFPYIGEGSVIANSVELRPGPSPAYPSGGQVHSGDTFVIRDIPKPGWLHVDMTSGQNANKGGYLATAYTTYYLYPSPQNISSHG